MVQYAHHHRDRRNIATHLLGFPLIFLSIGVLMLGPSWSLAGQTLTLNLASLAHTSRWCLSLGDVLLGVTTLVPNGVLIAVAHKVLIWRKPWDMRFGKRGPSAFLQIKYEVISQ